MRALVTGGAGFIGGHIAEQLATSGHDVVVVDNFVPYYDLGIKEHNVEAAREAAAAGDGSYELVEASITDGGWSTPRWGLRTSSTTRPHRLAPHDFSWFSNHAATCWVSLFGNVLLFPEFAVILLILSDVSTVRSHLLSE